MLTAQLKNGQKVSLAMGYRKEELVSLRKKEEFFCPVCGESVLLKLGDQRIFHFAHKYEGNCRETFENETSYHMEGKLQLYQWLCRQGIPAELEFYDRNIHQRPDIVFSFRGVKYALEFQCSTIQESLFSKRTHSYWENGYIPLWILSDNQLSYNRKGIESLSGFSYLFLRKSSSGTLFIPAYCPEKQQFHMVEPVSAISIKKTVVHHCFYPKQNIGIETLQSHSITPQMNFNIWNNEIDKLKMSLTIKPYGNQRSFLLEIYNRGYNLFLLPPEIGLPIHHSILLQTAPIIWQTYFYIDVLEKKHINELITPKEINAFLIKRFRRKEILKRNLPQLPESNPGRAIYEYLVFLESLGIVKQKGNDIFQYVKKIVIPKSNREALERKESFLKRHCFEQINK